jgi:hypothetical protein
MNSEVGPNPVHQVHHGSLVGEVDVGSSGCRDGTRSPAFQLGPHDPSQSWRNADALTKAAALAAIVYLLMQLRGNIWSGGDNFYAYRYAIEPLFLSTLLLVPAIAAFAKASHARHLLASFLLMLSVAIHWFGAVVS